MDEVFNSDGRQVANLTKYACREELGPKLVQLGLMETNGEGGYRLSTAGWELTPTLVMFALSDILAIADEEQSPEEFMELTTQTFHTVMAIIGMRAIAYADMNGTGPSFNQVAQGEFEA